ncbi:hypothetical protein C8R46DRAFT_1078678 [Mycena filopes]|nr:hypothetical protein C8R46DRAFT_1078678 [Mycena filopes]
MTHSVHVSTTEAHLNDFFTIEKIDFDATAHTATIHFEKSSAAKTALMLNGGTLDSSALSVTSDTEHEDEKHGDEPVHHIEQSDKPRAGIAAEYLAKGYTLSDGILQRAIEIDSKQGISKRFISYLTTVDKTIGEKALGPEKTVSGKVAETVTGAAQQARAIDEQKGYTKSASDYYTSALSSAWGEKVRVFYTTTSKQVLDIHEEAKRISAEQKGSAGAGAPGVAGEPVPSAGAPST